jgi:hypothetical protein
VAFGATIQWRRVWSRGYHAARGASVCITGEGVQREARGSRATLAKWQMHPSASGPGKPRRVELGAGRCRCWGDVLLLGTQGVGEWQIFLVNTTSRCANSNFLIENPKPPNTKVVE